MATLSSLSLNWLSHSVHTQKPHQHINFSNLRFSTSIWKYSFSAALLSSLIVTAFLFTNIMVFVGNLLQPYVIVASMTLC